MPKAYKNSEVLEFLKNNPLMSLAISENNQPTSLMLLFAIDDDFNIYFGTLRDSHKIKVLKKNNLVGLSIWKEKEMMVQARGEVTFLEGVDAEKALDKIAESAGKMADFWPPVLQIFGHDYIVCKIKPTWIRALDLSSDKIVEKENLFTEVKL